MFRSALIGLKPGAQNRTFLEFATALAARQGWRLAGISVLDSRQVAPAESVPLGGGGFKVHRDSVLFEATNAARDDTLGEFAQCCESAHLVAESVRADGDLPALLAQAAEEVDVMMLGHHLPPDAGELELVTPFHEIVQALPRPVIVVPRALGDDRDLRQIAVAYDGSLQAARTLQAFASSGLASGCEIRVITFGDSIEGATVTAMRAVCFLHSHEITAMSHVGVKSSDVGRTLLATTRDLGASLLVMGAYGESCIRDFLFGSVTKTALKHADLPLFISH